MLLRKEAKGKKSVLYNNHFILINFIFILNIISILI